MTIGHSPEESQAAWTEKSLRFPWLPEFPVLKMPV